MQDRRSKGLCFNCDKKFYPGHKCTQTQFLLLLAEEESHIVDQPSTPCEDINTMLIENQPLPIHLQLSPQALTGQPFPQTLRFKGSIDGLGVTILIDTGSSHNIMQPRIAHQRQLSITPTPTFPVMVGNGAHIFYSGLCSNVPITIQKHTFQVPVYLLPIQGWRRVCICGSG
uniref:Uncharacterized protein n=1 Tax=Cajanus cajan TaxID=3821 RepID=A0A151S563_CAJCA|nr:hypothetical protein KK1_028381 [Cajanus cajan]